MAVKENEVGKLIVINAAFDLSGFTELNVVFIQPDGTVITKTSGDNGVVAPAVPITVDIDGVDTTFNANEYWQYATEAGLLTPTGTWQVYGVYIDATPKNFAGDVNKFSVIPREDNC